MYVFYIHSIFQCKLIESWFSNENTKYAWAWNLCYSPFAIFGGYIFNVISSRFMLKRRCYVEILKWIDCFSILFLSFSFRSDWYSHILMSAECCVMNLNICNNFDLRFQWKHHHMDHETSQCLSIFLFFVPLMASIYLLNT